MPALQSLTDILLTFYGSDFGSFLYGSAINVNNKLIMQRTISNIIHYINIQNVNQYIFLLPVISVLLQYYHDYYIKYQTCYYKVELKLLAILLVMSKLDTDVTGRLPIHV